MSQRNILLMIAAFLAITIGSFIWYIATWNADAEQSISFPWSQIPPPEAPALTESATT